MDIDIDLQTNFKPNTIFNNMVFASMVKKDQLVKHNCGVYFQNIAKDAVTDLAAIPYEEAEILGYFKIDFLKLSLLDQCSSKQQIRQLISKQPNWNMLKDKNIVEQLFQIHNHYNLIQQINPTSVIELADVIALVRPGKKDLLSQYLQNREKTRKLLYGKTKDGYYFKKSHAISYALTIVLQLHLLENSQSGITLPSYNTGI